ncbi:PilX N-terminal domain-containing pilus assembly protein [Planctomycetota bacterium]
MTAIFQKNPGINQTRGIVLIVVLGTLALMSILALTFVSMMRLERTISSNYVDRTRAIFAAESGIEAAIAKIAQFRGGVLSPDELKQMQYNPDNPLAELNVASQLSFMSAVPGPGGRVNSGVIAGTHIAGGDSYLLKVEDESGKLNLNDSNELMNPPGQTGRRLFRMVANLAVIQFGAEKGVDIGTAVAIAIFDEQNRLGGKFSMLSQVNDILKSLDFTPEECRRFLSNITLWSWQDPDVIKPIPAWGTYEDAKALYGDPADDDFPKYGFPFMRWEEVQSFNDGDDDNGLHEYGYRLEPRSPVNINTASSELIQALLAGLEGWSLMEGPGEQSEHMDYIGQLYYGYWTVLGLFGENGAYCYPNYLYENTPRSSGLFWEAANSMCLDSGIEWKWDNNGMWIDGTDFKRYTLPYARLRNIKIPEPHIDPGFSKVLADDLYDRIHGKGIYSDPNPLENWREFKYYLDTVIHRAKAGDLPELAIDDPFAEDESVSIWTYDRTGDFRYFNEYYRDLVLANFDPNTMTNDFNPDLVVYRHTDKADLISYSTELSFEPTGTFRIESVGHVLSSADNYLVLAEQAVEAVVRLFEFKRLTTQAQLVGKDTSTLAMAERFGQNESASVSKWGNVVGYANGARLVSHPEPFAEGLSDPFEFVKNANFDGRIGLAPLKHNTDRTLDGLAEAAVLWTYFEGSMNAYNPSVVHPGLPAENETYLKFQIDRNLYNPIMQEIDIAEELRECENPLMTPHSSANTNTKPGTLFVDGAFSEAWKCPAYPIVAENGTIHLCNYIVKDKNYIGGDYQTLLMSIKPGFMMKDSNRGRNFFNLGQGGSERWSFFMPPEWREGMGLDPDQEPIYRSKPLLAISRLRMNCPLHSSGLVNHPLVFGCGWSWSCRHNVKYFSRTNFVGTNADLERIYWANGSGAYHFEGRRWNIIAATWAFGENLTNIIVNGYMINPVSQPGGDLTGWNGMKSLNTPFKVKPGGAEQFKAPIRLGAFARPQGHTINLHQPADSTYGEFVFYNDAIIDVSKFSHLDGFFWEEGFYYYDPGEPATYTTPEINLGAKAGKSVTIRSISWTGRWPQYLGSEDINPVSQSDPLWGELDPMWGNKKYQPPVWLTAKYADDPAFWDPFTMDVFYRSTTEPFAARWLYADNELESWPPPKTPLSYSGGSIPFDTDGCKLKTDEPIKLKFYFNLAPNQVEKLRESPYLDDITISYIPAHGVKFLYYQMH